MRRPWLGAASVLALTIAAALTSPTAAAQSVASSPASDPEEAPAPSTTAKRNVAGSARPDATARAARELEEVVVTGTNISGVKPVGSEAVALNREQIIGTGMTTAADVIRTLPQVRNLGDYREGGTQGSNNSQQGNAINLRGLGAAATLVLVDGHRVVPTGASANFTEANQVPLSALERIEIIADGASAVYGSDAVAGVVNYVLRKNYQGLEASMRASNANGGWEYTPSVTGGLNWDAAGRAGNMIVSYEFTQRRPWLRGNSPYLRQDLRPLGGPDLRISNATGSAGSPGNIVLQGGANAVIPRAGINTYYGLPASSTGLGITVSQLRLNDPNLIDTADFTDYTGRLRRHHVSAFLKQEVNDGLSVFAQGTYTNRLTYSRQISSFLGSIANVTVHRVLYDPVTNLPTATSNPAYIAGLVPGGGDYVVQYNFYGSTGGNNWRNDVEAYNVTGGFKARLPMEWKGEAYFTYGYDNACNFCATGKNYNPDSLQYLVNIGSVNPQSTATLTSAQLDRLYGDNIQRSGNSFKDFVAKADGPLFDLPAGAVRVALGAEIAKLANWNINGRNKGIANTFVVDTDKARSIGRRTIRSVFGEIYFPIIGEEMDLGFVRELNFNAAVRHDDYSDVGSTTNPKIGGTLELGDMLTVRGSWGRSFRAPGLPDVNPTAISGAFVFASPNNNPNIVNDFCLPGGRCFATVGLVNGANSELTPERAENWSMGADFNPTNNLRISATYYNIAYSDRILAPGVLSAFTAPGFPTYDGFGNFVIPINNTNVAGPNTCSIDPKLEAFLDRPILYGTTLINPCTIKAILDGRNTNLAATKQDGIDVQAQYSVLTSYGLLNFDAAVSKVLHNKQQVQPGASFVEVLGRADQPVEWRGRGSVGIVHGEFSATLFANHVGSYEQFAGLAANGLPLTTPRKVKSWTTFDLNLGYARLYDGGLLKGLRASINIQNLFNKNPPLNFTEQGGFTGAYANPFGRVVTVQMGSSF